VGEAPGNFGGRRVPAARGRRHCRVARCIGNACDGFLSLPTLGPDRSISDQRASWPRAPPWTGLGIDDARSPRRSAEPSAELFKVVIAYHSLEAGALIDVLDEQPVLIKAPLKVIMPCPESRALV
jgi:hypothetical protein